MRAIGVNELKREGSALRAIGGGAAALNLAWHALVKRNFPLELDEVNRWESKLPHGKKTSAWIFDEVAGRMNAAPERLRMGNGRITSTTFDNAVNDMMDTANNVKFSASLEEEDGTFTFLEGIVNPRVGIGTFTVRNSGRSGRHDYYAIDSPPMAGDELNAALPKPK